MNNVFVANENRLFIRNAAVGNGNITTTQDEPQEADQLKKIRATFDDEIKDHGVVPIYKKALLYGSKITIKDT